MSTSKSFIGGAICALSALCGTALASETDDLARAAQNPIAAMISVPLQWNTYFDTGPQKKPLHVLNVQPVVPFKLNQDWNLITRTILPLMSMPAFADQQPRENGLGDMQLSLFLSPAKPLDSGWIVGAGVITQFNTHTDARLATGGNGLGPTVVALRSGGPWTYGALLNNVWSDGNNFLAQPFVNYNLPDHPGTYIVSAPIITANWEATSSQRWTVPLGLGIEQITRFGALPVNLQLSAYYNVERPDFTSPWMMRAQLQFLFPK